MAKTYEIVYETNGGKLYDESGEIKSSKFLPGELLVIPGVPVKDFELFDGWYLDEDFVHPLDFCYMPRQDFVVYAKWKPAYYIIYLESNGGIVTSIDDESEDGQTEYLAIKVRAGDKIRLPKATNEGDKFLGWFKDRDLTEPFDLEYMPEEDITVYAKWEVRKKGEPQKITVKRKVTTTTVEKVITHNRIALDAPAYKFKISRQDILDFVESMNYELISDGQINSKKKKNEYKFPVMTDIRERTNDKGFDSLKCGKWTFALLKEKKDVLKLTARMNEEMANHMRASGHEAVRSLFPKGEYWYDVVIDTSFDSKREVYSYLEEWYFFVLGLYYTYNTAKDDYETDEAAAIKDENDIASDIKANEKTKDELFDEKIKVFTAAVKAFKDSIKLEFSMSKQKITDHIKETQPESCTIVEREKTKTGLILPNSFNWNNRTYLMVYEKKGVVKMVCRCSDAYADNLSLTHVEVCRSRFPKGKNWYDVVIDGTFSTEQEVWDIIEACREFVIASNEQNQEIDEKEIEKTL